MNTIQEQDMTRAFATSDFYQLLSVSLRLPTNELAEALLSGSYRQDSLNILEELNCNPEDIAKVDTALDALIGPNGDETSLIELRREYTRLFDDPKQPALNIYETLFLHGPEDKQGVMLFMSPAAYDAERCYKEAGVSLVNQAKEPADHLATELEFMMYLYAKKGKALQENNGEELENIEKQIRQFDELHLKKWCLNFFEALELQAKGSFYQGLARLAKAGLGRLS